MGLRDRIAGDPSLPRSNGDGDGDGVSYYRRRLLEEVNLSEIAELSSAQRRARLERVVGRMVSREGPVLSTAERTRLIRRVIDPSSWLDDSYCIINHVADLQPTRRFEKGRSLPDMLGPGGSAW